MGKEGVCPVEARSGDMGRIQKCCCHCKEKIHVAKAQLQMKLARTVREIKNKFFKYINGKKQIRNNTGPFQDEDGLLTNRDMDMAEVFNASLPVFSTADGPRGPQCLELEL